MPPGWSPVPPLPCDMSSALLVLGISLVTKPNKKPQACPPEPSSWASPQDIVVRTGAIFILGTPMGKVEIMEGFPEEAAQEQSLAVREGMATGLIHEPKGGRDERERGVAV